MPNSKRPVVYLSGPISKGNRSHNLFQFMDAHRLLLTRGYAVINPGLTAMLPWDDEVPHEEWLAADLPIVERCDLVIRLPGDSLGGDMEVDHAIIHGIPVLHVESRMDMELQLVAMDSDSWVQETEDREVPSE